MLTNAQTTQPSSQSPANSSPLFAHVIDRVRDAMQRLYVGGLPFHNWEHAQEVYERCMKLADLCQSYNIPVRREALACAAYTHDALFMVAPELLNFQSKEELAGNMAKQLLESLGAPTWFATEVQEIVHVTHVAMVPRSIEQKIIRAADLGNIGGDYDNFKAKSINLHEEGKILNGSKLSLGEWAPKSMNFLARYVWPFIQLTPHALDQRNVSAWHRVALSNIARFLEETAPAGSKQKITGFAGKGAEEFVKAHRVQDREVLLAFDPEDRTREKLLSQGQEQLKGKPDSAVLFYAPGSGASLPLNDKSCDEFNLSMTSLREVQAVSELSRVMKAGGEVKFFMHDKAEIDIDEFSQILYESGFDIQSGIKYREGVTLLTATKR